MSFAGAAPPGPVVLRGRYVTLAPLDADAHAAGLSAADRAGDPETWRWLPYGPWASPAEHCAWLEEQARSTDPRYWTLLAGGEPLGVMSLLAVVPEHGRIELGHVWLSRPLQRTPAATEATYLLADHCFALGYRRFEWKTNAHNALSRRAAERFGFTYEGTFRHHMWVKGENRDTAWFSLLGTEWPAARAAFCAWLDPANFDADGVQRTRLEELRATGA